MESNSHFLDPRKSFTAKIFASLLACSFVFISLVGLLSNSIYQGSLEAEVKYKSKKAHEFLLQGVDEVVNYLSISQEEIVNSPAVVKSINEENWGFFHNYLSRYKLGSANFFSSDGSLRHAFQRNSRGEFNVNETIMKKGVRLDLGVLKKLNQKSKTLFIYPSKESLELVLYQKMETEKEILISEIVLKVKNNYFSKLSKTLDSNFVIQKTGALPSVAFPLLMKNFLGEEELSSGDQINFQGNDFHFLQSPLSSFPEYYLGSFTNIDSLMSSLGRLHFRVFVVCLGVFILLSPLLYWLSRIITKPIEDLNIRLDDFVTKRNLNLLPITNDDEVGSITKQVNKLFSKINDMDQEIESRVLETVVVNQKNSNLKGEFSRIIKDYLLSRIYRRYMESLVSSASLSQSVSVNSQTFLRTVRELVQYLESENQHKSFLRKHNLSSRLEDLLSSTENLANQSLHTSETLIDHIWLMDEKSSDEESCKFELLRSIRLMESIYPRMKIKKNFDAVPDLSCNKSNFRTLVCLVLFLVGKQSRDGNSVELSFKEVQDKQFQKYLAMVVDFENSVSFELEDLDYEGQHLIRMMETTANLLQWPTIFPMRSRSKIQSLKFQVQLVL